MHRYFYDWEFQEQHDSTTNTTRIFPISLGMVSDDGRELYLVNNSYFAWEEMRIVETSQWVRKNVINHISDVDRTWYGYNFKNFGRLIQNFISDAPDGRITDRKYVELWGYYSAYDHVALAQCFGAMIDLPQPIPMFTNDIKQLVDGKTIGFKPDDEHHALSDARWNKKVWELYK